MVCGFVRIQAFGCRSSQALYKVELLMCARWSVKACEGFSRGLYPGIALYFCRRTVNFVWAAPRLEPLSLFEWWLIQWVRREDETGWNIFPSLFVLVYLGLIVLFYTETLVTSAECWYWIQQNTGIGQLWRNLVWQLKSGLSCPGGGGCKSRMLRKTVL
jgi:hypothetical protein